MPLPLNGLNPSLYITTTRELMEQGIAHGRH